MPPCASSNTPVRSADAPVNAPRLCPNSSDSTRSSGSAAQFSVQNILCRRELPRWIARATSSLPLPLSPSISTANGAAAARATLCRSSAITGVRPSSSPGPLRASASVASTAASSGAVAAALIVITSAARDVSWVDPIVQRTQSTPIVGPPYSIGAAASRRSCSRCGAMVMPAAAARSAMSLSMRAPSAAIACTPSPRIATMATAAAWRCWRNRPHTLLSTATSSAAVWHARRIATISSAKGSAPFAG